MNGPDKLLPPILKTCLQVAGWFCFLIGCLFAAWVVTVAGAKQSWSGVGGAVLMAQSLTIFWCSAAVFVCACTVLGLFRPGSRKDLIKAGLLAAAGGLGSFLVLYFRQSG